MKHLRILASLATVLAAAGCSSSASPDNIAVALSMGEKVNLLRAFTSTTNGSTVTVLGAIATSDPCYDFGASVATTGSVIEATVRSTSQRVLCIGLYNQQNYTLTVTNIPAGSWTLRVMHREDSNDPVQKFETAVTVSR